MEFCLECQNFVKKGDFVKHVKTAHGFKTKKGYLEKWQAKAPEEEVEEVEVEEAVIETEQPIDMVLSEEEFGMFNQLNNNLSLVRSELGRVYQILNALLKQANDIEQQFVDHKQALAEKNGLADLNWKVDLQTRQIIQ